jgi:hypothetical protein
MKNKKLIIVLGLAVIAGGVVYYGYKKGLWLNKKTPTTTTPTTTTPTTTRTTTSGKLVNIGRVSSNPTNVSTVTIRR